MILNCAFVILIIVSWIGGKKFHVGNILSQKVPLFSFPDSSEQILTIGTSLKMTDFNRFLYDGLKESGIKDRGINKASVRGLV